MIIILHRVNTIPQFERTPITFGVEVDLRDYDGKIAIQHDPLKTGESFEEYLRYYRHRFIILNVKCEGIEEEVLKILKQHRIDEFFLLDLSFPAIVKLVRNGERRIAVRFSEFESLDTCLRMRGLVDWAWVDGFNKCPLDYESFQKLAPHFKLCVVSPELQGRPVNEIALLRKQLAGMKIDAVCTKRPDLWQND